MKKIIKGIGIIFILGALAFVGVCAYGVIKGPSVEKGSPVPPSISKANYSVTINGTGRTIFTNNIQTKEVTTFHGEKFRVYTMPDGYWEVAGKKFVFKKVALVLDERIFGSIIVRKR